MEQELLEDPARREFLEKSNGGRYPRELHSPDWRCWRLAERQSGDWRTRGLLLALCCPTRFARSVAYRAWKCGWSPIEWRKRQTWREWCALGDSNTRPSGS